MESIFTEFLNNYRQQFISAGRELDREEIPPLTEELFSLFERTGSRLEYENVYFKRRRFLTVYAMLSIMYGEQSHISRLEEIIGAVIGEECWALPAHVDRSGKDWRITIDLFAAETAFSLAEITCLLKSKLSADLWEKVRKEIFRRVLEPFEKSAFPYSSWEVSQMNWCAVCCGSVGGAAIYLLQNDKTRLDRLLKRINGSIVNYIKGFSDDGACLEGLGYYTYGMSFFTAYADLMYIYSKGKVDLFEDTRLKNIALFQQKCFLTGDVTISFSDSRRNEKYRPGLTAYLSRRFPEVEIPSISLAADLETDNCYRYIVLSRDYFWTKDQNGNFTSIREQYTVLTQAQWAVFRSDNDCVLAAKGGHNDEPHNHNDVGSFIYACEGEIILDDIGAGEYTKDYFGENRYKYLCCRSLGHNVPLIDGKEQLSGAQYRAANFVSDSSGKTELDIEAAYGLSANDKLTRSFFFERDSGICTVTDSFRSSGNAELTENLVTSYKPVISGRDFIIPTPKNEFLIRIANGEELSIIKESYKDHYGVKRDLWLMQWRVLGGYSKIVIGKTGK
ncbi:MAG: heparinase II/III-family protein [Ruminiclostridium sp.]|nr:heparinase II/III-family protein [Ruminiclostridium sp.]